MILIINFLKQKNHPKIFGWSLKRISYNTTESLTMEIINVGLIVMSIHKTAFQPS